MFSTRASATTAKCRQSESFFTELSLERIRGRSGRSAERLQRQGPYTGGYSGDQLPGPGAQHYHRAVSGGAAGRSSQLQETAASCVFSPKPAGGPCRTSPSTTRSRSRSIISTEGSSGTGTEQEGDRLSRWTMAHKIDYDWKIRERLSLFSGFQDPLPEGVAAQSGSARCAPAPPDSVDETGIPPDGENPLSARRAGNNVEIPLLRRRSCGTGREFQSSATRC